MPRVSIVTVAYNAEPYIAQAIESALQQTEPDFEMIIVDNASTDATRAVVEDYAYRDPRIRLISSSENFGAGHGRNVGIRAATGEWVAILDADDWFHPDRLEFLLDAADRDSADLVADNQFFMMDGADKPHRVLRTDRAPGLHHLSVDDILRGDRCGRIGNLGLLKPIFRRRFLERHGIEYDVSPGLGEDFYILIKCLRHTPFLLFDVTPLYYYRIHPKSWSNSLTMEAVRGMRTLHERNVGLFEPSDAPVTARLMRRRGRQIDRYVAYRVLVDPIKRGNLRKALRRMVANPTALPMLAEGLVRYMIRRVQAALHQGTGASAMTVRGSSSAGAAGR
jgi:succinoglycan biosynthesis protein ExoO